MKAILGALAIALAATPSLAGPLTVTVARAWVRPAPVGGATAGYFTLVNRAGLPDRLTGAASPAGSRVSLHESRMIGAMSAMRPLAGVGVPGRGPVVFAPGGKHLMIEGLRRPLRLGDTVPITLRLERAGAINARFQVRATAP